MIGGGERRAFHVRRALPQLRRESDDDVPMWAPGSNCAPLTWHRLERLACSEAWEPAGRPALRSRLVSYRRSLSRAVLCSLRISLPPVCLQRCPSSSSAHSSNIHTHTHTHSPLPPASPSFALIRINLLDRISDHQNNSNHTQTHFPGASATLPASTTVAFALSPIQALAFPTQLTSVTWPLDNTLQ
jgi:hypothetical protein